MGAQRGGGFDSTTCAALLDWDRPARLHTSTHGRVSATRYKMREKLTLCERGMCGQGRVGYKMYVDVTKCLRGIHDE